MDALGAPAVKTKGGRRKARRLRRLRRGGEGACIEVQHDSAILIQRIFRGWLGESLQLCSPSLAPLRHCK